MRRPPSVRGKWQSMSRKRRGGQLHMSNIWHVYILKSVQDGGYYIGCTSNIYRRLKEHNLGKTVSLRKRLPLLLVYSEQHNSKEEAFVREKQIKSYKGGVAFKKLLK